MSLAIIAGSGDLPLILHRSRPDAIICELSGSPCDIHPQAIAVRFRIETLGSLIAELHRLGVQKLCLAGGVSRPKIDPAAIDKATEPLVAKITEAIADGGDDATLRIIISIFQDAGFQVIGPHEICPELLPPEGPLAGEITAEQMRDIDLGFATLALLSKADLGQACVVKGGRVIAVEAAPGTDWMLHSLRDGEAWGGCLVKGPKTGQELRVDMPTVGPDTVEGCSGAGLSVLAIQGGSVLMLHRAKLLNMAHSHKLSVLVRPQ